VTAVGAGAGFGQGLKTLVTEHNGGSGKFGFMITDGKGKDKPGGS
jgi:hypothetical protein